MQFSQILGRLMKERGWSAYRLAKLMDVSQSTVSHWLASDTKPQRNTMRRLEEVFGVERGYFENEQKENPRPFGFRSEDVDFDLEAIYRVLSPEAKKQLDQYAQFLLSQQDKQ